MLLLISTIHIQFLSEPGRSLKFIWTTLDCRIQAKVFKIISRIMLFSHFCTCGLCQLWELFLPFVAKFAIIMYEQSSTTLRQNIQIETVMSITWTVVNCSLATENKLSVKKIRRTEGISYSKFPMQIIFR